MTQWENTELGSILTVRHGFAFTGEGMTDKLTGNPILVSIGNFDYGGGFRFESTRVREFRGDYPAQFDLNPGDLVVVMTCQTSGGEILGLPGLIPDDGKTYLHNQRIGRVDCAPGRLDKRFAYYMFLSPEVNRQLFATATGTKILHTSPGRIGRVALALPGVSEQVAIARVLGALDDKIAINRRVAAAADELSGSLFRHAMLQSSGQSTRRPLSETSEFINGRAFTKDATGVGRMVVRIAEINSGPSSSTVYNDIDVPENHLARPGDVLFAWSGSLTVARWFRPEAIINQHIFKCIPKNGYQQWLVSQLVHQKIDEFRAIAADKATTMGHIQRKHLDGLVHVPVPEALRRMNAEIGPLWDRALVAEQESLTLVTLRDTLLPQLMSGRLRVRDAEKIVEDQV